MSDDNDLEKALEPQVFTPSECMICFENIIRIEELCVCENCKKEWCISCDISWRVTRMSASLLPTCPFCRKRLESLVVLREEARTVTRESVITDQQLFDRLMMSLIKWISYVMLAIVLIILPVVQVYFTENEEAFLSYFCLILFIFIFLCCQYMKRVERAEEEHDDGSELTV